MTENKIEIKNDSSNNDMLYYNLLRASLNDATAEFHNEKTKNATSLNGGIKFFVAFGLAFGLACILLYVFAMNFIIGIIAFWILILLEFVFLLNILILTADKKSLKIKQARIDSINDEIELYQARNEDEKVLAGKEFKIHQNELKRYYDLNISQIKFLSRLGIALIFIGLLVIIATVGVYIIDDVYIWIFITSIVSGVLINFIGAFFISMYTENMKVAISLHSRLAGSNNLLLANFIVAKIENKEKREDALAQIAKGITTNNSD